MPEVNVNKELSHRWRLNFKLESRFLVSEGQIKGNTENQFTYLLSDLSTLGSYKVGIHSKIAAGYLLRITTSGLLHRSIQQFSFVQTLHKGRVGHRIVTDQTFARYNSPVFRFRYRLSYDTPLQGDKVDSKEFYFKASNEYINLLSHSAYDLEIRLTPSLGFAFTDHSKIEFGAEYRLKTFIRQNTRHDFWVTLSWYLNI